MAKQQTKYLVQNFGIRQRPIPQDLLKLDVEYSALFSKFEDVRDCLRTFQKYTIVQYCDEKFFDKPLADENTTRWRFLIREIACDTDDSSAEIDLSNSIKNAHRAWCYNIENTLLWTLPDPEADRTDFERFDFEGKFSVGDIVFILPQCIEPNSASFEGDFGVVIEIPVNKDAWLGSSKPPDEWDANYHIQYIDRFGFLDDCRLSECCLTPVPEELPKEQAFLPIWSKFLIGKAKFPEGLADRIRARKVHLLNVPRYDFANG